MSGDLLSANMFTYCKNNPVNISDPSGYFCLYIGNGQKVVMSPDAPFVVHNREYDEPQRILPFNTGSIILDLVLEHYVSRIIANKAPANESEAISLGWTKLKPSQSVYHQIGAGNEFNSKYISPGGHLEGVYYRNHNLVTDPINMGTYNFCQPTSFLGDIGHAIVDVFPYYLLGNVPAQINFNNGMDRVVATAKSIYYQLIGQ